MLVNYAHASHARNSLITYGVIAPIVRAAVLIDVFTWRLKRVVRSCVCQVTKEWLVGVQFIEKFNRIFGVHICDVKRLWQRDSATIQTVINAVEFS